MNNNFDFQPFVDVLPKAKQILIALPVNPSLDAVAGALALYLSLLKTDKNITIGCSSKMTVGFNRLFAVDKITDNVGNRNLIISFGYIKEAIEKVSYNVEDGKFNLVVEPRNGCAPLDSKNVSYSYSGTQADIIFVIGAKNFADLGKLYNEEKELFDKTIIVNINTKNGDNSLGKINLVNNQSATICEIVSELLKRLSLSVNPDIATNLLAGMESVTNNFQAETSAKTFEAAAWCLRNGGRRGHIDNRQTSAFPPTPPSSPTPGSHVDASFSDQQPVSQQPLSGTFISSTEEQGTKKPEEDRTENVPPPDWFKPKIFKGGAIG